MVNQLLRLPLTSGVGNSDFVGNTPQQNSAPDQEQLRKIMLRIASPETDDPEKPTPKSRIPLPDYKNPESRLNYAKQFAQKYGPLMSGRGDTPLRVNEIPDTAKDRLTAKQLAINSTKKLGIDPALFYASAMEEGMSGLYKNKEGNILASHNKDFPVSGFHSFGLDTFSDAYPGLVKKGYLPPEFANKFSKSVQENEKGEKVNSADFMSAEDALMAKAAMIKSSDDEIGEYAKKNKIELSPKAKQFFALVNYNAGSGNAQKMLQSYSQKGYLKGDAFLNKRPDENWQQPYENVIRRTKMAEALKNEGYFDDEQTADKQKLLLKVAQK